MMEVVKSQRLLLLNLVLAIQIGFLSYLFFSATREGRYFLAHEDEVINYCSAKLFSETGSIHAEGCITEDVSRIGKMNWYGPGYTVIYGLLRTLLGDHTTLFIQIHFAFAWMTLLVIFLLPASGENQLLIANSLLFTEQFASTIFTYFPETFHHLLALILILLLLLIHRSKSANQRNLLVTVFIGLVMVLTMCRVTTIFWLAALVGLSETKRMALKMTIVFTVGLSLTLLYMKFFTAPPYAGEMLKIGELYEFNLLDFVWKTIKALLRNTFYLLINGSISVYFVLALLSITVVRWWQTKERFLLAALLISLSLMSALMAYYSSYPWYFLKQSAVLVPLLIVALMRSDAPAKLKYGILVMAFVSFLFTFQTTLGFIEERKDAFVRLQDNHHFQASLEELQAFITEDRAVTILWCYNEYDFGGATEALLPFSTKTHQPILYTTNIVDPGEKPEIKFEFHHKLTIDYILSRSALAWPSLQEVYATEFYHFYKIRED